VGKSARKARPGITPGTPVPALDPGVLDAVVELLAEAILADLQQFPDLTVVSRRGVHRQAVKGRDAA
jgi:hypothetical protein